MAPDKFPFQVLYEDNHLLVVQKPAGLATMGLPEGRPTLLTVAKDYIKTRYDKPGNVYLGLMSRLDAPVTGVVLIARTSKAARRLTDQFKSRSVSKTYWAMVEGHIRPRQSQCIDWLAPDERHRKMHVVAPNTEGAKEARLAYERLSQGADFSLLEIALETGRKHQIRLQLAKRGHPVLGDYKYGSRRKFGSGIALHARSLTITHPTKGDTLELVAPLPPTWREYGVTE